MEMMMSFYKTEEEVKQMTIKAESEIVGLIRFYGSYDLLIDAIRCHQLKEKLYESLFDAHCSPEDKMEKEAEATMEGGDDVL